MSRAVEEWIGAPSRPGPALPEGDLCPVCAMQPVATCRGAYAGCPVLPDAAREAQREPGRQEGQS